MRMLPRRRNDFDLFGDDFMDPFFGDYDNKIMRTDIKENKNNYVFDVDLPGVEKGNIKISLNDGYLEISAKKSEKKDEKEEGKFLRKERYFGNFSRSFYVGDNVKPEEIKASFKNGNLRLVIPKKDTNNNGNDNNHYIEIDD